MHGFALRGNRRGVTLVETLIVVALIALLSGGAVFGSGMLKSSRMKGASTLIASSVRLGLARANSTGRPMRLVLDLDGEKVLLEEGNSSVMLREKGKTTGGAEAATEAEQAAKAESDRILEGPRAPRPSFTPAKAFSETPEGRELGAGVDLAVVQTEHDEEPQSEGRAYVYFWPGGVTERAHIQLKRKGSDEGLTVVVSALTGRTRIERGLVDMPEPRSDREEDQGEREAP
ncbi:MAG TPA: prepilin-type N-terminal cleavage/methylation domain-containing protein [Polyangiaceae bacterium]